MRSLQIILFVFYLLCPATLCAQIAYQYGEGMEIPLDDFPVSVTGYRIQLGAFSTESFAIAFRDSLQKLLEERVHLNYAGGFWRVRVGDFEDSSAAVSYLNEELTPLGYPAGIVVADKIKSSDHETHQGVKIPGFRIQINALSDRDQALDLGRKLDFDYPDERTYVIFQGGLYRVQFGDFRTRSESEVWLGKLGKVFDTELWIVPTLVYQNPPPSPLEHPVIDQFEYSD